MHYGRETHDLHPRVKVHFYFKLEKRANGTISLVSRCTEVSMSWKIMEKTFRVCVCKLHTLYASKSWRTSKAGKYRVWFYIPVLTMCKDLYIISKSKARVYKNLFHLPFLQTAACAQRLLSKFPKLWFEIIVYILMNLPCTSGRGYFFICHLYLGHIASSFSLLHFHGKR